MIIDSNALQSQELRIYLAKSKANMAVLNDYAAMEAYKGDTLNSIFRSMEILAQFPEQVIVLKPTTKIFGLNGREKGLQRRMVDEDQTRGFPEYCRALQAAEGGHPRLVREILENGREADKQMDLILASAPVIAEGIHLLRKEFTPDELKCIRQRELFSPTLIQKSVKFIFQLALESISRHPKQPPKPVKYQELQNLFAFRHSICAFVWSLDWIGQGGPNTVRPEKLRNDLVDVLFATYATYFDRLLSKDAKARRIYEHAKFILGAISDRSHA
jgi:hypothetical protein